MAANDCHWLSVNTQICVFYTDLKLDLKHNISPKHNNEKNKTVDCCYYYTFSCLFADCVFKRDAICCPKRVAVCDNMPYKRI